MCNNISSVIKRQTINEKEDLEKLISNLENLKNAYFRGVNNASYQLTTSAHRFYCSNQYCSKYSYKEFLSKLYLVSKQLCGRYLEHKYEDNQSVAASYYTSYDKCNDEFSLIPYNSMFAFMAMQHYSAVSPLLDFSSNLATALYFAIHDTAYLKTKYFDSFPKDDNSYIQLIYFEENQDLLNAKNNGLPLYQSYADYVFEKIQEEEGETPKNLESHDISKLGDSALFYLKYGIESTDLLSRKKNYVVHFDNENIIAQEGILLIIPKLTDLENFWEDTIGKDTSCGTRSLNVIKIHRCLVPYISDYIAKCFNCRDLEHELIRNVVDMKKELKKIL